MTSTDMYFSFGRTFKNVGTDGAKYNLYDFKAIGMSWGGQDFVQLLDGENAATYFTAVYLDDPSDPSEDGWYDPAGPWSVPAENIEIDAGTGFLCAMPNCNTDNPVTFVCNGEVEKGRTVVATTMYAFFANPIPCDLKLYDIKAVGMSWGGQDFIQLLDGENAATYFTAVYLDDPSDPSEDGWYDPAGPWSIPAEDVDIPAGQAFLCAMPNCDTDNPVTFIFPDPFELKK